MSFTLLGLRLFQADMLYTGRVKYWDLPKYSTGKTVLAKSEQKFDPANIPDSIKTTVSEALDGALKQLSEEMETYDSYILTDHDLPVFFSTNDDKLILTGEPYYLFTKFDIDYVDYLTNFKAWMKTNTVKDAPDSLQLFVNAIKTVADMQYSWEGKDVYTAMDMAYNIFGPVDSSLVPPVIIQLVRAHVQAATDSRSAIRFNRVTTGVMESLAPYAHKLNPAIVTSFVNTMRYTAFFRYAKQMNPANYQAFLMSIRGKEKNDGLKGIYTPVDSKE